MAIARKNELMAETVWKTCQQDYRSKTILIVCHRICSAWKKRCDELNSSRMPEIDYRQMHRQSPRE
jgi:hypothetical protein